MVVFSVTYLVVRIRNSLEYYVSYNFSNIVLWEPCKPCDFAWYVGGILMIILNLLLSILLI